MIQVGDLVLILDVCWWFDEFDGYVVYLQGYLLGVVFVLFEDELSDYMIVGWGWYLLLLGVSL